MNANPISVPVENDRSFQIDRIVVSDDPPAHHDPETLNSLANVKLEEEWAEKYPGLRFQTLQEMSQSCSPPDYIIEDTLVAKQPCLLAGSYKSMKTTLAIDLVVSLITGKNFLGVFRVLKRFRVLLMCGESGSSKIIATTKASLRSKGVNPDEIKEFLRITTEVPSFSDPETLAAVESQLGEFIPEVVILDPLYLALIDEQASIINNGLQLKKLTQPYVDRGITIICVDHFRVTASEKGSPNLASLSGAGKAAFFRQWILIKRKGKFPSGPKRLHNIELSVGGSQGHSWQSRVEITEEFEQNQLTLLSTRLAPEGDGDSPESPYVGVKDNEDREVDDHRKKTDTRQNIIKLLQDLPAESVLLQTAIRNKLRLSNVFCLEILNELCVEGTVVRQQDPIPRGNGRFYHGYRLSPPASPVAL